MAGSISKTMSSAHTIWLIGQNQQLFHSRTHFYRVAAHLMRLILVDQAAQEAAGKPGRGRKEASLNDAPLPSPGLPDDLLSLDEELTRLAAFDHRKSSAVELRYFGGLSLEAIAETLSISVPTAVRELRARGLGSAGN